jgi:hypothetical protein
VALEQTCKAPRAERRKFRRFVATLLVWILLTIPHEAAGLLKPGVPRALA